MPSNLPIKPRNFCKNFCTNYGLLNIKKGLFLIQLFLMPIPVITGAFGHNAIQDFFNKNEMEIQFLGCFISHIKNDRTHSDMKCQFVTSSSRTEEFYALKCCTLHKHAILTNHLQETVNGFVPLIAYYSLIGATCRKSAKNHESIWVWQKNYKKLACYLGLNCVTYFLIVSGS